MHSGSDWWRSIDALFWRKHGCRRRFSSVRFALERSSLSESLRGELLPYVWRCPSGWLVFGGCVEFGGSPVGYGVLAAAWVWTAAEALAWVLGVS